MLLQCKAAVYVNAGWEAPPCILKLTAALDAWSVYAAKQAKGRACFVLCDALSAARQVRTIMHAAAAVRHLTLLGSCEGEHTGRLCLGSNFEARPQTLQAGRLCLESEPKRRLYKLHPRRR